MKNIRANNKCWICGNAGNSKEHKHKASLLKRNFGKKYAGKKIELHKDGKEIELFNYKDDELVFKRKICVDCNNILTKPHDDAYDTFMKYIEESFSEFKSVNLIDFEKVYEKDWRKKKKDLIKYYAKMIGCRINEGDYQLKLDDLIKEDKLKSNFTIWFVFKEQVKMITDMSDSKFVNLFTGGTRIFGDSKEDVNCAGWMSYQWISVYYLYSNRIKEKFRFSSSIKTEPLYNQNIPKFDLIQNGILYSEALDLIENQEHDTDDKFIEYCEMRMEKYSH